MRRRCHQHNPWVSCQSRVLLRITLLLLPQQFLQSPGCTILLPLHNQPTFFNLVESRNMLGVSSSCNTSLVTVLSEKVSNTKSNTKSQQHGSRTIQMYFIAQLLGVSSECSAKGVGSFPAFGGGGKTKWFQSQLQHS